MSKYSAFAAGTGNEFPNPRRRWCPAE